MVSKEDAVVGETTEEQNGRRELYGRKPWEDKPGYWVLETPAIR
jgi:hypothetical protein